MTDAFYLAAAMPYRIVSNPMDISTHPAVLLGHWLRSARQSKNIVKRLFAGQILLNPSEYTEMEAGVIRWLKEPQRRAIIAALDLAGKELEKFNELLTNARKATQLSFSNLFSREELEPIRYRYNDNFVKPDEMTKEVILNAVFSDIA